MDAKRLEELVTWATVQEQSLLANQITDIAEYYADLARCAAAWGKLDAMLRAEDGWSIDLWRMSKGRIRLLTNKHSTDGDTAIAAVEAAPE